MPLPTVLVLAEQMITRLESLHTKGFIHRDVKPRNFAMGTEETAGTVYIIDYGLSKAYINPSTRKHIAFAEKKKLTGTETFVSVNAHMGYEQSRRDDLESLGYSLVYLAKGGLPWQGVKAETEKELRKKVYKLKSLMPLKELCSGLAEPFSEYLRYCKTLLFQDKPDYNYLRKLFMNYFHKQNLDKDFVFYWDVPKDEPPKEDKKIDEEIKIVLTDNKLNNSENDKIEETKNEPKSPNANFEMQDISEQSKCWRKI
eukprot:TRINITY_DN983_c0_g1_i12.p1 TRINITY_DN983_c0_g1~~TRINITY_DN983_c0_g1_i12.p1  ORF type:complete len:256 (-),score=71.40 TRINITY_DN983_c0_g1_i12:239-1006(-)